MVHICHFRASVLNNNESKYFKAIMMKQSTFAETFQSRKTVDVKFDTKFRTRNSKKRLVIENFIFQSQIFCLELKAQKEIYQNWIIILDYKIWKQHFGTIFQYSILV